MPALTRGYLRAMLVGKVPPRNEEEFMITVMHSIKKYEELLVAWAEKVCAIVFFLVIIFVAWAAWYGINPKVGTRKIY